jgi:hypothetical protein
VVFYSIISRYKEEDQLRNAPQLVSGWESGGIDRSWERNIHDYYRVSPYW